MPIQRTDYTGARFQACSTARELLLTTLHDWLGTEPEPDAVETEVTGTVSAIRQVTTLLCASHPDVLA